MSEERRAEIVWLLEHRNDHLPGARSASVVGRDATTASSGFVGGLDDRGRPLRFLTCPDCLANGMPNGRGVPGCETCGGSGEVPDDGPDPMAENKIMPVGFASNRHDATHERDRKIEMLERQMRPAPSEAELLEEANRRGYAWEEERRAMYRQYDFALIDEALDVVHAHDVDAAHALNAVYVDGWLAEVGEVTPAVEVHCERGLELLGAALPESLRTPLSKHPALVRRDRKRQRMEDEAA